MVHQRAVSACEALAVTVLIVALVAVMAAILIIEGAFVAVIVAAAVLDARDRRRDRRRVGIDLSDRDTGDPSTHESNAKSAPDARSTQHTGS